MRTPHPLWGWLFWLAAGCWLAVFGLTFNSEQTEKRKENFPQLLSKPKH
jgi:hypothetical protein